MKRKQAAKNGKTPKSKPPRSDLLDWIVQQIVARFNPRRIILFGSRARGNALPDSDYDLCVEMESDKRLPERIMEVSAIFGLRTWSMDLLVFTPEEMRRFRDHLGSIVRVIENEGKVLYERP